MMWYSNVNSRQNVSPSPRLHCPPPQSHHDHPSSITRHRSSITNHPHSSFIIPIHINCLLHLPSHLSAVGSQLLIVHTIKTFFRCIHFFFQPSLPYYHSHFRPPVAYWRASTSSIHPFLQHYSSAIVLLSSDWICSNTRKCQQTAATATIPTTIHQQSLKPQYGPSSRGANQHLFLLKSLFYLHQLARHCHYLNGYCRSIPIIGGKARAAVGRSWRYDGSDTWQRWIPKSSISW